MNKVALLLLFSAMVLFGNIHAQDTIRLGDDSVYLTPPAIKDSFPYYPAFEGYAYAGMSPVYGFNKAGEIYFVDTTTTIYGIAFSRTCCSLQAFVLVSVKYFSIIKERMLIIKKGSLISSPLL